MDEFEHDVDQRLGALRTKVHELWEASLYRSAIRVANEIRRVARAEKRVIPYLNSTFTLMNQGIDLLDPEAARDAALELQRGGIGYYPKSDFVHLDTGRFRTW